MNQKSSFQLPDEDFLAFVATIKNQCEQHSMTWQIDSTRMATLSSLLTLAVGAYNANKDRALSNHATAMDKKRAFADLKHNTSIFVDYLELNDSVPDEGLATMHLRPRTPAGHQPIPVPTEAPLVEAKRQHGEVTVYVTRKEYGQPTDGVQLKPYHGFAVRWRFEAETSWRTELSTRLHHTLYFDSQDETRRIILSVAWVNPRLQEGPWSENISEVIG